nr:hypothetical protein [Tanacetum cinerariifolium]
MIPNITSSERPLVTTTVFAATTPENTPIAYHASTLANPNPKISPAFVEANYEVLESLLRERRRHIRNEDLRTELEYFSEDYDEEQEIEPRHKPNREVTPTLRLRSLVVHRQRDRVVGFEEAPNREGSRRGRNTEGIRPSEIEARQDENIGVNLPPLLAGHLGRNRSPMYAPPNMPVYPNPAGSFVDSTGSVTPFVRWIEDYPLPDGLKMPSHIGSYDGKRDPDNFLHLFKGAITYTLKDFARIWWNSQKTCSILNYEDLKAKRKSWSIRKIPLEITIGDAPLIRKETLNFVIIKSDLPYNMLLGRKTMYNMGIMVSTIYGDIKFHTTKGIGTVFLIYESDKVKEGMNKVRKTPSTSEKGVFSCTTTEEKVVVNNKYSKQTVTIKKQLREHFKGKLRDLLRANADVFA